MTLNLKRSSVWSIAEVAVSGISLFLLYKYVVAVLGLKALGIWSLVLATTSLARFGDLGAAAGLSRFVALAQSRANHALARTYVETAFLTNLAIYSALSAALLAPLYYGVAYLVPQDALAEARQLLPYSITSFVLLNLNSVTMSALVGRQRTDLKSKVVIVSTAVQVGTVVLAVPHFGLVGMAFGQIAQYSVAIITSWMVFTVSHEDERKTFAPIHFSVSAFRELLSFGVRLQSLNLLSFAFEPATKFVISAVGGLEALGVFEMAYRMVLQIRHLVVAPMQALLPAFTHLLEHDPVKVAQLYDIATLNAVRFGTPLLCGTALVSPAVSWLWIGRIDSHFVCFSVALSVGWLFNLISAPAGILGISRNIMRWNLFGSAITSFVGPTMALLIGWHFGVAAAAATIALAGLAGGAIPPLIMNTKGIFGRRSWFSCRRASPA